MEKKLERQLETVRSRGNDLIPVLSLDRILDNGGRDGRVDKVCVCRVLGTKHAFIGYAGTKYVFVGWTGLDIAGRGGRAEDKKFVRRACETRFAFVGCVYGAESVFLKKCINTIN